MIPDMLHSPSIPLRNHRLAFLAALACIGPGAGLAAEEAASDDGPMISVTAPLSSGITQPSRTCWPSRSPISSSTRWLMPTARQRSIVFCSSAAGVSGSRGNMELPAATDSGGSPVTAGSPFTRTICPDASSRRDTSGCFSMPQLEPLRGSSS